MVAPDSKQILETGRKIMSWRPAWIISFKKPGRGDRIGFFQTGFVAHVGFKVTM